MIQIKKIIISLFILLISLIAYKYSPYKIEFIGHYNKILAHRVNSLEKLKSALNYFNGVELDLVYNKTSNVLDVNHPPAISINLNFEDYISKIDSKKTPFLWLDIKNLTNENSEDILTLLLSIFNERDFPLNRVLIETRYPEALLIFTNSGFKTSYYLPSGLRNKNDSDLNSEIIKISNVLKKQPNIGISSDYRDYQILKDNFPSKTKYLWMISSITERWFSETRSILKDNKVEIVLVNYNAIKGNR